MIVAGFDCETTGLSKQTDFITEVGLVLWDTEENAPVDFYSSLIKEDHVVVDPYITELTGITNEMLQKFGRPAQYVFENLHAGIKKADCIVAHNGKKFDFPFLDVEFDRYDIPRIEIPKIDTSVDVPYPQSIETRKQVYLAAEHGFVNPFPHRALTDVLTMLTIMSKYDFVQIFEMAKSPEIEIRAMVSFQDKDLAKATGYRYNGDGKIWTKVVKESQLVHEERRAKEKGFDIIVL